MRNLIFLSLNLTLFILLSACAALPSSETPASGQDVVLPTNTFLPLDVENPVNTPISPQEDVERELPTVEIPEEAVIIYRRSGGFAGLDEEWMIYEDGTVNAKSGDHMKVDPGQVSSLLETIDGLGFFELETSYMPKSLCCDLFSYELVVHYKGVTMAVAAMDGADAPDHFWSALDAIRVFIEGLSE